MNVCAIGSDYAGRVTSAVFGDLGDDVTCVDDQDDKIRTLRDELFVEERTSLKRGIGGWCRSFIDTVGDCWQ